MGSPHFEYLLYAVLARKCYVDYKRYSERQQGRRNTQKLRMRRDCKEVSLISFSSNKSDQCYLEACDSLIEITSFSTLELVLSNRLTLHPLKSDFFLFFFPLLIQLSVLLCENKPEQTLQNYLETYFRSRRVLSSIAWFSSVF